jgi:hypothetical protein
VYLFFFPIVGHGGVEVAKFPHQLASFSVCIETCEDCNNIYINNNTIHGFKNAVVVKQATITTLRNNSFLHQNAESVRVYFDAKIQSLVGNTFAFVPYGIPISFIFFLLFTYSVVLFVSTLISSLF